MENAAGSLTSFFLYVVLSTTHFFSFPICPEDEALEYVQRDALPRGDLAGVAEAAAEAAANLTAPVAEANRL